MLGQYQTFPGQRLPLWGQNQPFYGQNSSEWGQYQNPYGQNLPLWGKNQYQHGWNPQSEPYQSPFLHFNPQFPFLDTLELPDMLRLTNDPILHSPYWPLVPTKSPGDCPKFEGKFGEDPQAHVMTYHLWCSSNSWVDDSIRLRLFQRTLMGAATKWYIELRQGAFQDLNTLAMAFLTHFKLLV